jgi:hypothetical protein
LNSPLKDIFSLNATDDDMVQGTRGLPAIASRAGFAGHAFCKA